MKKLRNRILVLVGVMVLAFTGLAGCKKKSQCWNCEEMKYCEPFDDYNLGTLNLCKDCKKLIKPISDRFRENFEGIQ